MKTNFRNVISGGFLTLILCFSITQVTVGQPTGKTDVKESGILKAGVTIL